MRLFFYNSFKITSKLVHLQREREMVTAAVLGAAVGLGGALVLAMAVLIYYYHAAQRKQLEFDSYYSNKMERETSQLSSQHQHQRHHPSAANHYYHHHRGSSATSSYKSSTSLQIDGAHGNKRTNSPRSDRKQQLFLPLMRTHQVNWKAAAVYVYCMEHQMTTLTPSVKCLSLSPFISMGERAAGVARATRQSAYSSSMN